MKQKLLLLALLSFVISFANPKAKTTTNPAIGIMMSAINTGFQIIYNISIKNTGDEVLTNIYIQDWNPMNGQIQFDFSTIPSSLAPGEELTGLQAVKNGTFCFDQSQVIVHATPSSSTTEITDLSSDPTGFDNNNLPGSYYNDFFTNSFYFNYVNGTQQGTYVDANNNSIVDVGDVINYTYDVYSSGGIDGEIFDNNAIIANPFFTGGSGSTTGIHYITQAEATLGYVYNTSNIIGYGPCDQGSYFYDASPCSGCPNPDNANIITPLTSDPIKSQVKSNSTTITIAPPV
jgi:uncharacterized repeat protein (TIGR01451 family)